MGLPDTLAALRQWRHWLPARRPPRTVGGTEVADARLLAEAERRGGGRPDGCAWLDERTIDDLDLGLVFRAIDRTATPTGAQALWRWLTAPAVRLDVLADRERSLARLASHPDRRDRLRAALAGHAASDAPLLPRLLWEPAPPPVATRGFALSTVALLVLAALAIWWPPLIVVCLLVLVANVFVDEQMSLRLAHQGHALGVLCRVLAVVDRVTASRDWYDASIARDLAVFSAFRKRVALLTVSDPFGAADLLRAGLHVRSLLGGRQMRLVERERERLRRLVLWVGELDALIAVATLRAERTDARLPRLSVGAAAIAAADLVHPAVAKAVGNDVAIAGGLLVTGSNTSGKSTFIRTVAVNAVCAQSIHTTFGTWQAGLFRVFTVMRITDETAAGLSTYVVEVAAIGELARAVSRGAGDLPALFVVDEPFRGTNPVLRVPIVVSVLEYCAQRDLVVAATHDLDVAEQLDARFDRAYFAEADDAGGHFDRKLRPGISPASNALALLVRAGYPSAIVAAVERRVSALGGAPRLDEPGHRVPASHASTAVRCRSRPGTDA